MGCQRAIYDEGHGLYYRLSLPSKGTVLSQVSDVVQVESPFGIAFACILSALFSDRILASLGRLLEHFGFKTA
jgi:hypothetical protein